MQQKNNHLVLLKNKWNLEETIYVINKHFVRFWMSTEDVERTFIDPEEITVLGLL